MRFVIFILTKTTFKSVISTASFLVYLCFKLPFCILLDGGKYLIIIGPSSSSFKPIGSQDWPAYSLKPVNNLLNIVIIVKLANLELYPYTIIIVIIIKEETRKVLNNRIILKTVHRFKIV